MTLLIYIQITLASLYFCFETLEMTGLIWLFFVLNLCSILSILWVKDFSKFSSLRIYNYNNCRMVFTLTLIVLELLLINEPSYAETTPFEELLNDVEIFITGILVGVLWFPEITRKPLQKPEDLDK
jgi:hypothetical protein